MVIWDVLIAHHHHLYAGEINLKDSASLIVLWWFVLQKHWETPSVEYFTCVNTGSSWPRSHTNSENGSICALGGDWRVTQNSLHAQRPLLWICSRWWSDQSSRSHPELSVAYSPHPVHCNSSDGKLHYFQGKGRASQPDFIKSHAGDCLLFSKSKQKDLLSFDPFSPHPIMQSCPL